MNTQNEINKIYNEYTVINGRIVSPGKFEGESIATVYFYNMLGEIGGDFAEISDEERNIFKIDLMYSHAIILTDDSGYTWLEYTVSESHAEDRVREWYNEDESNEDDSDENESNRCSQCEAMMIQGVYCHETGCPEAWKTQKVDCRECGFDFQPEEQGQNVCDNCIFEAEASLIQNSNEFEDNLGEID